MSDAPRDEAAAMTPLQRAFLALEETRARLAAVEAAANEPVAIIGLGCRVPGGGNDAASFWKLMQNGTDAIGPIPPDRWDASATYDPDPEVVGRIAATGGGFIDDVRGFDAGAFGVARREAQGMDPQQRLFLEVAWEALENAGQAPDRLERSSTGVYVGVTGSDYAYLQLEARDRALLDTHFASGIAHSIASGRLSYLLGLQGPALTIDTACSSSLVAIHLACQALRAGDCQMALAGGVNLILAPDIFIALSRSRMLAPDGRCKTFDAAADGFARGEGCGAIVLKRLSRAHADGDRILAVIRGSAVNQDGPSSGLTAPNGPAQEAVIRLALDRAGVLPSEVGYIEAHGTGTQLGDPLEVSALAAVFGSSRPAGHPLWIGSVKTNVGHLEAAAGVTGLIKLILALRARELPPHLHFRTPSPHITWGDWVAVPTSVMPWVPIEGRRLAGVSSFGFSGTNAHIVLEEAPPEASRANAPPRRHCVFVLSARDATGLREMARRYLAAFSGLGDAALPDACFSASAGRAHLPERAAIVATTMAELRERLVALAEGREGEGLRVARVQRRDPARIAFLFTGQGAQYAGMVRRLDEDEPAFREALDRCAAELDRRLPRSLRDVLYSDESPAPLDSTGFTQPVLFAVEYALAELWRSWGVEPDMLIGHSIGEVVAACVGGILSLPDALALVTARGALMQSLPPGGAMAAIFAPAADVEPEVARHGGRLSIAGFNGPRQVVISGDAGAVDAVAGLFTARGVRAQRLPVSHAFHSPLVDPILDAFEAEVSRVRLQPPGKRIVSNLTGTMMDQAEVVQPRYWRRHVREPVQFAEGMRALAAFAPDVCLEVGPHPTLLALAEENLAGSGAQPVLVASLRKGKDDQAVLAEALGTLYLAGVAIDWREVWRPSGARWIDMPPYAFQRVPAWFTASATAAATGRDTGHPLLGTRLRSALRDVVQFEQVLRPDTVPFLADHRVQGSPIFPATGFIELLLAAGQAVFSAPVKVQDLDLVETLRFADDETRVVQVLVRPAGPDAADVEVLSSAPEGDAWQRHVVGRLVAGASAPASMPAFQEARARMTAELAVDEHRARLAARGLDFGPSLHGLKAIWPGEGEAIGEVHLPDVAIAGRGAYLLHPALLDACLQVMSAALPGGLDGHRAWLPMAIGEVVRFAAPAGPVWSHALVRGPDRSGILRGEVWVHGEGGPVAMLGGIVLRAAQAAGSNAPFYQVAWPVIAAGDADWVPGPADLAGAVGPRFATLAAEHGLDDYQEAFRGLEALSADWILAALAGLGWNPATGDVVQAAELAARLGVAPQYGRLLARYLEILAEEGVLGSQGAAWRVLRPLPARRLDQCAAGALRLLDRHPASRARIELSGRCGSVLAEILKGTVDPLQQLFPDGSTALAEALYRDAPEARAWNQLLRDAVTQALGSLPPGRRCRILEAGGGTGGTTAWLAPALPAGCVDYLFTDVGPSMVQRARERFAASHPFMDFCTFDLEQPAAPQGLDGRQFDVIIAANVIHATTDLRQVIARLRDMLAPGGVLFMLEVAGFERWIDITFGLTQGWWRFTDTTLRAGYPLLTSAAWLDLLAGLGFEAAAIGDGDARTREVLLAARKPAVGPSAGGGTWLLMGEGGGLAAEASRQLQALGAGAIRVAADAGDAALTAFVREQADSLRGILHFGALDLGPAEADGLSSLLPAQEECIGPVLSVVRALGACSFSAGAAPRLCLVTRGAVALDSNASADPRQATMLGLGRVVALEHPELRCLRIDLDGSQPPAGQCAALLERVHGSSREDQVALRAGVWHAARLEPLPPPPPTPSRRLERGRGGSFDDLELRHVPRRAPARGEVEIRVVASGLNFRDVMNAVALRDDPEPLGGECAGRIVALGADVTGLAVGDHVVGVAEASFADYATTAASLVRRIPDGIGFADAATLPFAFMTADHALTDLAGLRAGEAVLIHAGAGGVGMAAIQLARNAGATIFATAGTEARRERLRRLGVAHALDSRSLDFETQVRELTDGRGVDVVLNSLAGDFIPASVRCLSAQGRFLEIGKRDTWTPAQFTEVRPAGRYWTVDLAAMRYEDPAALGRLFDRVLEGVTSGRLRPLPLHPFPLEQASAAFRFMAMARHVGKVVLTNVDRDAASLRALDARGAYLVTGGLSGLGFLTAQRLAERGARYLVLAGRRAPGRATIEGIESLRAAGVTVTVLQADVSDPREVAHLLRSVPAGTPLRGVIHSAGALADGALLQQDWTRFAVPLGAKVDGAWALNAQTRALRLDFFVMYSSIAGTLGSAGQANHAAANAFMDALASMRRDTGDAALSIAWGAWAGVGAAADRGIDQRIDARGLEAISPGRGLDWLELLMDSGAQAVAVMPMRWAGFLSRPEAASPLFDAVRMAHRRQHARATADAPVSTPSLVAQLRDAPPARRHELLLGFVADHVARVIGGTGAEGIDPEQPLSELGLDSLMAVELRNRLGAGLGLARSLPATLVFDHPTLEAVARFLGREVVPAGDDAAAGPAKVAGDINAMSDDEIERLFAQKMQRM